MNEHRPGHDAAHLVDSLRHALDSAYSLCFVVVSQLVLCVLGEERRGAMVVEVRSSVKYGTVLSFTVLLLAYWFRSPQSVLDERLGAVLSSLLRAERKVGMSNIARPRVAIGNYTAQCGSKLK